MGHINKHDLAKGKWVATGDPKRANTTRNLNVGGWIISEVIEVFLVHVQTLRAKGWERRGGARWI